MTTELSEDCLAIINAGEWKSRESLSMIVQADGKRLRVPAHCTDILPSKYISIWFHVRFISNPIRPSIYLEALKNPIEVFDDKGEQFLLKTAETRGVIDATGGRRVVATVSVPVKKILADFAEGESQ